MAAILYKRLPFLVSLYIAFEQAAFRLMANLYGCDTEKNPYVTPICAEDAVEKNKVIHIAFVEKGETIDKSTPAAFATSLLTLEAQCKAVIIRNIIGSKPDPTTTKGKGYGRAIETTLGKIHIINYLDRTYVLNVPFYNSFESNAMLYDMYYMTDTYAWIVEKVTLNAEAKDAITDDNTTNIEGSVEIKWSQKGNPLPVKILTDRFDKPQELFDVEAAVFNNGTGSSALISSDSSSITKAASQAFQVEMQTGVALDKVTLIGGIFPTGVTAAKDGTGQKLVISGSSAQVGTKTVVLQLSNECGLTSTLEVNIVIT